jgi:hypothetical protein
MDVKAVAHILSFWSYLGKKKLSRFVIGLQSNSLATAGQFVFYFVQYKFKFEQANYQGKLKLKLYISAFVWLLANSAVSCRSALD